MTGSLFQLFKNAVGDPARPMIRPPDGKPLCYGDCFATAARFAHVLVQHGVRPGDRIAVQVEKSPSAVCLYLACLRAGAVYLPLNTGYTPSELSYFVGDAEPSLFVCAAKNLETISGVLPQIKFLTLDDDGESGSLVDQAAAQPIDFPDADIGMTDLASILYTSGTTGRSKGAMLTHGNLCSNAESLKDTWHFTAEDVLLHALPIFHIHGLFVAINVTLISGASLILLPKFGLNDIFRALPSATVMMGVPTFYTRLIGDSRLKPEVTRNIRLFISGSAPLLADTHREWQARTGHAILERYGMTETNMNTSNPYDGPRLPGSVGKPLPGVELRIASKDGAVLPQGEIGLIEVRGPNVFKGYWRMPDRTAAEFRADAFFITGDLGRIDENGYVHILGRDKDLIITGGFNVYPKEIEILIDELPGVTESAVVGLPHRDFGEGVTACVVTGNNAHLTEKEVLDSLIGRLAKFKHPKRVVFLEELPRNTMGKVQKNMIREKFAKLYD